MWGSSTFSFPTRATNTGMFDKTVTTRLSGRGAVRVGLLLLAVLLCGGSGCSKKERVRAAVRSEYAQGNHEEVVALCERALRGDLVDAEISYYYGLSLLSLDRDVEALDHLHTAVSMNRTFSTQISAGLVAKAREATALGRMSQAARRVRAALEFQPGVNVGPLEYLVADSFFQDRRWEEAARHYDKALTDFPENSAAEKGFFNLAACYAAIGDSAAAIEVLGEQLAGFPQGPLAAEAEWTLVNLVYGRARSEFQRGNYDAAVDLASSIVGRSPNAVAVQRARFLLGEAYERLGAYASAYEQYESIVGEERGATGRLVERARDRMRAIREAGLR